MASNIDPTKPLPGTEPYKIPSEGDILSLARKRASEAWDGWRDNFRLAEADLDMLCGDHWDESAKAARDGRPTLTINELPQHVDQIVGDILQKRPVIKIRPVGSGLERKLANQALVEQGPQAVGAKDFSLAEVYNGLVRQIWATCKGESHLDRSTTHAVESGFGWLRVLTESDSADFFQQIITVRSIKNRFSVLIDPLAVEPNMSDARYAFVFSDMSKSEFDARYPDAGEGDITGIEGEQAAFWAPGIETVRVAEYYWREAFDETYVKLSDGSAVELSKAEPVLDELAAQGITEISRRKVTKWRVMWAKVTGQTVLEKARPTVFSTIPIVPVLGKELTRKKGTVYRGAIRYSHDPSKMQNYWLSAMTEKAALTPKGKWVAEDDSVEDYEEEWRNANISNDPLLRFKTGKNPPVYVEPPSMPATELQIALSFTDKIKSTTGIYDASLGNRSNETSGKGIIARQQQGDRGTFAYQDNMGKALERIGRLLLEAIPQIYDGERQIRIRNEDGAEDVLLINKVIRDEQTGKEAILNDLSQGNMDFEVDMSPNGQSQRMDAVETFSTMLGQMGSALPPAMAALMAYTAAKNVDAPGVAEFSEAFRKQLVAMGAIEPDKDTPPPQPQPPTPEQQLESAKIEAEMAKAKADEAMAQAKALEAQAKMAEIQAQAALMQDQGAMVEMIRDVVADALAEVKSS
ncbi:MAG: hypothetical protein HGA87_00120 [Desulfobulbaceae bacterium]|nr:hypothetical protein [Desulfobulbaceae bacterium]